MKTLEQFKVEQMEDKEFAIEYKKVKLEFSNVDNINDNEQYGEKMNCAKKIYTINKKIKLLFNKKRNIKKYEKKQSIE